MTKNLGFALVAALSGAWKLPRHTFARVRGTNATPTLTRRPRHFHRSRAARPAPRPLLWLSRTKLVQTEQAFGRSRLSRGVGRDPVDQYMPGGRSAQRRPELGLSLEDPVHRSIRNPIGG